MTYLTHYGVKGMRWGVRKERQPSSSDHVKTRALRKRSMRTLSNAEMQSALKRIRLEAEYKKLNPSFLSRLSKTVSSIVSGPIGKAAVKTVLKSSGASTKFEKTFETVGKAMEATMKEYKEKVVKEEDN